MEETPPREVELDDTWPVSRCTQGVRGSLGLFRNDTTICKALYRQSQVFGAFPPVLPEYIKFDVEKWVFDSQLPHPRTGLGYPQCWLPIKLTRSVSFRAVIPYTLRFGKANQMET